MHIYICLIKKTLNKLAHAQVRATSLQELVYKGGQCGVTKATVTLIFDNTDPSQCPLGYDKCREITVARQVVVGGKNKYMINGKIVLNKKVSDLFCSVQLNINNPNFLIMQGRITKVLNMKAIEVGSRFDMIFILLFYRETCRYCQWLKKRLEPVCMNQSETTQPNLLRERTLRSKKSAR